MEIESKWIKLNVGEKEMSVFQSSPKEGNYPCVIVLQEIFGVNHHIRDVTERVAKEGFMTLSPDLFHRQEERFETGYKQEDMSVAFGKMRELKTEDYLSDVDYLLAYARTFHEKVGIVGFCMGGRLAFITACTKDVQAAVAFYGGGIARSLEMAENIKSPVLLFFGGIDDFISFDDVKKVDETLNDLGKEYDVVMYPEGNHGFFCNERSTYNEEAAKDSWDKTKGFLKVNLK